jgi:hypothetical protein
MKIEKCKLKGENLVYWGGARTVPKAASDEAGRAASNAGKAEEWYEKLQGQVAK